MSRLRTRTVIREHIESILVAILIALVLRAFVLAAYKIPTASMTPTLKVGDLIFAWKVPYGVRMPFSNRTLVHPRAPSRGEVVVFRYPEDESLSFVKRVVGVPGDKIEIRQKRLFVNDKMASYNKVSADDPDLKDLPLKDLSIVEREDFGAGPHWVMFRKGEDDDAFGPQVIPEGKFFVLGDNRDSSDDSRFWGLVPLDNLEGRAILIWGSLDWEHRSSLGLPRVRFERVLTSIR